MGMIPKAPDFLYLGKLTALIRGASCQLSVVCLQPGGSVGEDVSSGKPALIIKDESVASWWGFFLSHPCAFSETMELGRPRLYRGQKVIVTQTFLMKSVSSLDPPPPFCSDSLHRGLIYEGFFFFFSLFFKNYFINRSSLVSFVFCVFFYCGGWVFVGVQASRGGGFSCCGALALGHAGFDSCSSRALEPRLSSCGTHA